MLTSQAFLYIRKCDRSLIRFIKKSKHHQCSHLAGVLVHGGDGGDPSLRGDGHSRQPRLHHLPQATERTHRLKRSEGLEMLIRLINYTSSTSFPVNNTQTNYSFTRRI